MYKYRIVDSSVKESSVNEGKVSLEELKGILPNEIYEMLLLPGTIAIRELSGHMSYEVSKV